jgi:hypothetical protein
MTEQRFALEWDRPLLPDASTHVSLFDGGKDPLHVVASGHGAGDANALGDLLTTLRERNESADVIAYVSGEYAALVLLGEQPAHHSSSDDRLTAIG